MRIADCGLRNSWLWRGHGVRDRRSASRPQLSPDAHLRSDARRNKLEGIGDQVHDHLHQSSTVPQHLRQRFLHGHQGAFLLDVGFQLGQGLRHDLLQAQRCEADVHTAEAAVGQQVPDQGVHALGSGDDALGVVLADRIQALRIVLLQGRGEALQGAQGRTQVVGDGKGEGLQGDVDLLQPAGCLLGEALG